MSKIYLRHDLSDQHLGKAEIKSLNNDDKPDHIDIPVNFGNLKRAITMTTSDVIAMAEGLGFKVFKEGMFNHDISSLEKSKYSTPFLKSSDSRLMENKADIISSSIDEKGVTTVKIKRDEE